METYFVKRINKWRAKKRINGKQIFIGYFNTEMEAYIAYKMYGR